MILDIVAWGILIVVGFLVFVDFIKNTDFYVTLSVLALSVYIIIWALLRVTGG